MEKRSRRRTRDLVTQPASQGLSQNEIGCVRISMMAKSMNALFTGRIQKRKTNPLHHSHLACNTRPVHTDGPISDILECGWEEPANTSKVETDVRSCPRCCVMVPFRQVRSTKPPKEKKPPTWAAFTMKSGCRWCDCPPEHGPPTTIYNRFVRWARRGVWENLFRELAGNGRSTDTQMIDSTHVKAHRSAAGGKGGSRSRLLAARAEGATRRYTHSQMLKGAFSPSC